MKTLTLAAMMLFAGFAAAQTPKTSTPPPDSLCCCKTCDNVGGHIVCGQLHCGICPCNSAKDSKGESMTLNLDEADPLARAFQKGVLISSCPQVKVTGDEPKKYGK